MKQLFVVVLLFAIVVTSGCISANEPPSTADKVALCSNGDYSTKYNVYAKPMFEIMLTAESSRKLSDALMIEGDSALAGISSLTCLEYLGLSIGPPLPKVYDISALRNLTNLKVLDLGGTNISDISPLSDLTNLKELYLGSAPVSDISPLRSLTNLESLDLDKTNVSDISALSNLDNLNYLDLSNTAISDISPLENLNKLETLMLNCTPVSDLSSLKNLKSLKQVSLVSKSISIEDCRKIKTALPTVYVYCQLPLPNYLEKTCG